MVRIGYVLYNPLAGKGDSRETAESLKVVNKDTLLYYDITKIKDYAKFLTELAEEDYIVICGGDGTLNRFINDTGGLSIKNDIYYFPLGTGNDFAKDLGLEESDPFRINDYIKDLPIAIVKGKRYRFLNAVGYGIDGYCCEVGDKLKQEAKVPNYTAIAIKGLLHGYKPTAATVTVDGETHAYKKVWIAPTMNGRYYGGGMMPAPKQSRNDNKDGVSLAVIHDAGKLRTLSVFPSIFKGEHIKHRSMVDVYKGRHIAVAFDRPVALQIDGETILDVNGYEVIDDRNQNR